MTHCFGCMEQIEGSPCPKCGFDPNTNKPVDNALPMGTIVNGKYMLGKVLGQGGFGITYIGLDLTTQQKVAVKEFFPSGQATRLPGTGTIVRWNSSENAQKIRMEGAETFLREGRKMARVVSVPGVVNIVGMFSENDTAYIVMEYIRGKTLMDHLKVRGVLTWPQVRSVFRQAVYTMEQVHRAGIIHRDLSPDNLMICPDGTVKVLDLGAAKDLNTGSGASSMLVAKNGFSPMEQYYQRGSSGPSTDVYAMSATIYFSLTGVLPPTPMDRIEEDRLRWDLPALQQIPQPVLRALQHGMAVLQKNRMQSMRELLDALNGESQPAAVKPPAVQPVATQLVSNISAAQPGERPPAAPPEPQPSAAPSAVQPPVQPSVQRPPVVPPVVQTPVAPPPRNVPAGSNAVSAVKQEKKKPLPLIIAAALAVLAVVAALILIPGKSKSQSGTPAAQVSAPDQSASTSGKLPAQTEANVQNEAAPAQAEFLGGSLKKLNIPRKEALTFAGQQWSRVNSWNVLGYNQNNSMVIAGNAGGYRSLMFETLFMYNTLTGEKVGLLAESYEWNTSRTQITVKLKDAAHWCDGTPVTARDVAATWQVDVQMRNAIGGQFLAYISDVHATNDKTVVITSTGGNPLKVEDFLTGAPIAQAAWIETLKQRCGNDNTKMGNDPGDDVVWSGPYTRFYSDDEAVVLIRDDNYWGKDSSMWGKLPVPRYIVHRIYRDNAEGEEALRKGDVDVCQQYVANLQNIAQEDGVSVASYYSKAPYQLCETMPTAWYNMNVREVRENAALRKAIAMAVDYDSIIAAAVSGQSPSFRDVPRSLMNPTPGEQALYDHSAVASLQWAGSDISGAKALLDKAGLIDTNGDGIREYNGKNIELTAAAPKGWTDWQAAVEIVAAAGKQIGIRIQPVYPEWDVYQTVFTDPDQAEYGIFLWTPDASAPSMPWGRCMQYLSSQYVGLQYNWSGNWGQYRNPEADGILAKIPFTTNQAELQKLYTRLVEIYLTDVPSFSLMYRASLFYNVSNLVWTNFPSADDGRNIPPADCTDGYGIAALYQLRLA